MERYQRIYLDDNKLYVPEAGIVICAQAILKDNKTNKVIAQVKFQNTLDKEIVALFVNVDCYDITEKKLDSVTNYQFLDLKEKRDSYFGSKTAITLPDNNTRRISVSVQKLVYDDGTVWEKGQPEDYMLLTGPEVVSNDKEVCKQAQLEFGSAAQYKYQKYEALWRCSCGAINHNNERNCHSCGLSEDKLIETSLAILIERKNQRVAEETRIAQEEEKARAILEEEQRKRNKKIALVALGVGLIALTIFVIIATKPARTIARAEKYAEEGEYALALKELKDLNMPEKTQETYYEISNLFKGEIDKAIDNKEINKAITLLESYPELDGYDELYESVRSACPHEENKMDSKEVTCTESGYENQICKVCGKIFDEKVIDALGHDYKTETIKKATCTEKGLEHKNCLRCGYEEDASIDALGHDNKKTEIVKTTCENAGKYQYTCLSCGECYTEEIKPTGHKWGSATCTAAKKCSTCGASSGSALGHAWNDEYNIKCKRCSASYPSNLSFALQGAPIKVEINNGEYITLESCSIGEEQVYNTDVGIKSSLFLNINGYLSRKMLVDIVLKIVDENGNRVGNGATEKIDLCVNGNGGYYSDSIYIFVPVNKTYYISVDYVDFYSFY